MQLNDRKKQILKSVVDAYIASGEPVGSKYLTSYSNISLSPATIRNEMSELEEMGYLDKPHTSAGRVPSSNAYRLYVDELMGNYRLTMEELGVINELMHYKMSELDKIITQAGKVMSDLTHCVTVSFTKEKRQDTVSRFDTVFIDHNSFLLVAIQNSGKVKSEHMKSECYITPELLVNLKDALNEVFTDVSLEEITMPLIMKAEMRAGLLAPLVNPIIRSAFSCNDTQEGGNVKINGISNLLEYPEFSDVEKLRRIMNVFDKKDAYIKDLLTSPEQVSDGTQLVPFETESGVKVYIGDEDSSSALSGTSLIFCTVPTGDTESVIGILGPKRMDYKKAVSALKQFSQTIGKAMEENGTKNQLNFTEDTNEQ